VKTVREAGYGQLHIGLHHQYIPRRNRDTVSWDIHAARLYLANNGRLCFSLSAFTKRIERLPEFVVQRKQRSGFSAESRASFPPEKCCGLPTAATMPPTSSLLRAGTFTIVCASAH
jgi:hypothetical protein